MYVLQVDDPAVNVYAKRKEFAALSSGNGAAGTPTGEAASEASSSQSWYSWAFGASTSSSITSGGSVTLPSLEGRDGASVRVLSDDDRRELYESIAFNPTKVRKG